MVLHDGCYIKNVLDLRVCDENVFGDQLDSESKAKSDEESFSLSKMYGTHYLCFSF